MSDNQTFSLSLFQLIPSSSSSITTSVGNAGAHLGGGGGGLGGGYDPGEQPQQHFVFKEAIQAPIPVSKIGQIVICTPENTMLSIRSTPNTLERAGSQSKSANITQRQRRQNI